MVVSMPAFALWTPYHCPRFAFWFDQCYVGSFGALRKFIRLFAKTAESVSNSIRGKMSDSSSDSGNEMGENAEMEKVS